MGKDDTVVIAGSIVVTSTKNTVEITEGADDDEALKGGADADADTGANDDIILEKKANKNDDELVSFHNDNEILAKKIMPPTPRKRPTSS